MGLERTVARRAKVADSNDVRRAMAAMTQAEDAWVCVYVCRGRERERERERESLGLTVPGQAGKRRRRTEEKGERKRDPILIAQRV